MAFLGSVSQPPTTTYATHAQILSMLMGPDSTPPTPNTAQGPSLPATLSATLAAELHTQQDGGEILTIQDLEDMPDMEAPVASTSAQSGLVDDSVCNPLVVTVRPLR